MVLQRTKGGRGGKEMNIIWGWKILSKIIAKLGNMCYILSVKKCKDGFKQIEDEIRTEHNSREDTGWERQK